ncbi:MAG: hypothetical protein JW838_03550 [Spirochaetes bacterium]|nr:hypothetical protein [Spirochaetota bacterium]
MKERIITVLFACLLGMGFSGLQAQAQPVEEKKESSESQDDKKAEETFKEIYKRLDIGVRLYLDWIGRWGHDGKTFDRIPKGQPDPDGIKEKNNNEFRVQRAYIDLKYKIHDVLSARLTTDADTVSSPTGAFHIYLKYAYVQAQKDFGPVGFTLQGGMIGTPVVGLTDSISDYRWIAQNYLDQADSVLNGQKLDNSADLGVSTSIKIFKYVTLTGSFTNGTGYKKNENNSHKAFTYLLTINPTKEIYLSGFGRNEITDKYDYTGKKAKRSYYGYGVAYRSNLIKVGFNHIFPYTQTVGLSRDFGVDPVGPSGQVDLYVYPLKNNGYMLLDSWLNVNLGAVLESVPLLVTGRYVYGLQRGTYQKAITDTECGTERSTMLYALGLGWQLNKHFRILLGGELQTYRIRKDRVLRYAEGASGSEYYGDTFYIGSREPRDAKRVYIKTEVAF